jgi:undecaprenyl-diphosphatase
MASDLQHPKISVPPDQHPLTAAPSAAGWRAWLVALAQGSKRTLGALGLVLVAGFALGLLSIYLFAQMAGEVMEQETMTVDVGVLVWLQQFQSPLFDRLAHYASWVGNQGVFILFLALLIVLGLQRRWGAVVGLLLVTIGAQLLNNELKDWVQRTRPNPIAAGVFEEQAFSFPSGHAMMSAAFFLYLTYLGWRLLRGWPRLLLASGLVVLVLLIGLSRLYLGVHYLTDVIAGYIAGFIWTDTVIVAGHILGRARRLRTTRVARRSRQMHAPPA